MDEYSLSIILDDIDDYESGPTYLQLVKNQCKISITMPEELIFDDLEDFL